MIEMEIGKSYARFNLKGERISFLFGEEAGIFLGVVPSGFFRFKLSEDRECLINPHVSNCLFYEVI